MTRRTGVRTSTVRLRTVALVAVGGGLAVAGLALVALTRAQSVEPADRPALAIDASSGCELLVCTRDILSSHWRDGDVMQVFNAYDALRVHAETIAQGRGAYQGDAVPALRTLYDQITDNRRQLPTRDDLLAWWARAEALAGLNREDFARFPFTQIERRSFLVIPVDVDLTPALGQRWTEPDGRKRFQLRVDWRTALVAAGLAAEADVLDRSFPVRLDASLPVSIIDAQAVSADQEVQ